MSYEPLHHKYRPKTFAELVGQEAIATTLTNAIRSERIAPAYLFTGPRGTGKTSSARILAKSLNCKKQNKPTESPCGVCEVCKMIAAGNALDVIEIDAASNTGVDNIRELIERAQFAPVQCRYKVYVVDECHMLSVAAFNALLKTLEEPPARVVFVLATTDPQRVLPTIISRCQRFDFRRIALEAMVSHLQHIASKENIEITSDALTLIAQVAQGGLRDAESLLDQLSLLPGQVTVEHVWDLVGAVPERDLMALTKAIASDNAQAVLTQCRHLMDRGREPLIVLQNLAGFYRDLLIAKTAPKRSDLVAVTLPTWKQLCEFAQLDVSSILQGQQHLRSSEAQIKNSTQPRLWLEVTLLGLLPSALSANLVIRNENGSHSNSVKTSVKNRTEANPNREASANQGIAQQQPTERTTPTQQPVHPAARGVDSSTISVSESPITPPNQELNASSPSISAHPPTTQRTDDSITAASSDSKSTPPQAAQKSSDAEDDNDLIWQKVLEHLQPRATRELLRQHCRLLTFDRSVARIGISSEPLLKIAQSRLPNIEAAFEAIYNSKVNVSFQSKAAESFNTAPAKESTSPSTSIEPTPEGAVQPTVTNYSPSLTSTPDPPQIKDTEEHTQNVVSFTRPTHNLITSPLVSDSSSGAQTVHRVSKTEPLALAEPSVPTVKRGGLLSKEIQPDAPSLPLTPPSIPLPTQEDLDGDTDEVEKALGNLKQFFEGEIVELTDDFPLSESLIIDRSPNAPVTTTVLSEEVSNAVTDPLETELEEDAEELHWVEPATTYQRQSIDTAAFNHTKDLQESGYLSDADDEDIPF